MWQAIAEVACEKQQKRSQGPFHESLQKITLNVVIHAVSTV